VNSIYDIVWAYDLATGRPVTYGDVRLLDEMQLSTYNFELADVDSTWKHFALYEAECLQLLKHIDAIVRPQLKSLADGGGALASETFMKLVSGTPEAATRSLRAPVLAAYELCLKCSHLFNTLDARGAISVTERVGVIARVRALAVGVAKAWTAQQSVEEAVATGAAGTC
jgi:glycyl-tRNA synthetase alpha chain